MTKADIVAKISEKLGLEKGDVQATVETFMSEVKVSLETGDNVYLRGFGHSSVQTCKDFCRRCENKQRSEVIN
jgi:DNA-binding protein HU-beta